MNNTEEATVYPDGSTNIPDREEETYSSSDSHSEGDNIFEEAADAIKREGTDPAFFLVFCFIIFIALWYTLYYRKNKQVENSFDFFSELDGEKFNLKLPAEVDEYYKIKAKCEEAGWEPGQPPANNKEAQNGPQRVLCQALMKRCIADIPIVSHIQKESPGMNKLYSQSMCSVKQWKAYQAAEAMVSTEVNEVRAEADEINPGWSQVIWRQAMQYHNMLQNREEKEAKTAAVQAEKKKAEVAKKKKHVNREEEIRAKELAAEKAAEELIKAEEREKASRKAFSNGGMKKGFLGEKKNKKSK